MTEAGREGRDTSRCEGGERERTRRTVGARGFEAVAERREERQERQRKRETRGRREGALFLVLVVVPASGRAREKGVSQRTEQRGERERAAHFLSFLSSSFLWSSFL